MTTTSPKLGLTLPTTTDPFKTADIAANWSKIDGSPGVFPCTSSTRPTWGTAQVGRTIVETDTHRILQWTGTAWQEPAVAVGEWGFSADPNSTLGPNAKATYTLGTINVQRPCTALIIHTIRAEFRPFMTQWLSSSPQIDGVTMLLGSHGAALQWADLSAATSTAYDSRYASCFAHATLAPGSHTVSCNVLTGPTAGASIWLNTIQTVLLITSGNGGTSTI